MLIETRIKATVPDISEPALAAAIAYAVSAMKETRDAYREPVSLLEVRMTDEMVLQFTVRAMYTNNTRTFNMPFPPAPAPDGAAKV